MYCMKNEVYDGKITSGYLLEIPLAGCGIFNWQYVASVSPFDDVWVQRTLRETVHFAHDLQTRAHFIKLVQ